MMIKKYKNKKEKYSQLFAILIKIYKAHKHNIDIIRKSNQLAAFALMPT